MKSMESSKFWFWVGFLVVSVANGCVEEERIALSELMESMTTVSLNGAILDCCSWRRVACNLTTGRVIQLDLEAVRVGSKDAWSFNASLFLPFKALQVLILRQNLITGWAQNEGYEKLSHLTNLKVVDLKNNPIYPDVLPSLCWISSLEILTLGISGFDTAGFVEFPLYKNYTLNTVEGSKKCPVASNLRELSLIGYGIDDINVLTALGFGRHGGLRNLEKLNLMDNMFNSSIFASLKDLPSLNDLDLSLNEIHGTIEMNDIIFPRNLEVLILRRNNFEGFSIAQGSKQVSSIRTIRLGGLGSSTNASNVIHSLKQFSSLKSLSYFYSDLTAPAITYALRNLSTLEYLSLEGSYLSENFLSSIGQMTSLKVLDVAFGYHYGTLPNRGWCELKSMEELALTSNYYLFGSLPSCLANLTSLRWLDLSENYLTGNIATSPLRQLTSLELLDISDNRFEVPPSFTLFTNHSKLTSLNVGYNTITTETEHQHEMIPNFQLQFFAIQGCINLRKLPSFLHYQYDLRVLGIDANQLSGNFPTWLLENNTRLAGLYARDNAFIGPLKLPSRSHLHLQQIDFSNNKLNGHIPANMSLAFPMLAQLNMSQNFLEGCIPSDIGTSALATLDLSHNYLSGGVPTGLAMTSPRLSYLRLSSNKLNGKIFSEDVRPPFLRFLYLNGNNFEGALPGNLLLSLLIALDVSSNNFSGEIPRWIGGNTKLLQLDLSKNNFEGSIPVEICNLKHIQVLAMLGNKLTGSIPSCLSSLPLEHIYLSKNLFSGELEQSLLNISSLKTLDLGHNSFTGNIPLSIGSLYNLNYFLLNNNQLEGEIPAQICQLNKLSIMDFSFNKLYGILPHCLGNLEQSITDVETSTSFYLASSKQVWISTLIWISSTKHFHLGIGIQPDFNEMDVETQVQFSTKRNSYTYKGRVLKYMTGIDLSSNRLTGEIPIELGNLSKTHALNLSHNHLIGRIPETFSNLHEVESLDLSYNNLTGRIPTSLLKLNLLAIFSVAYNNLSGALPEFKAQFATFDNSSYEGNPLLCGSPLDACSKTILSNTSQNESEESEGFMDMETFYIGCAVSYGAILLGTAAALGFNPYWRRAWFRLIEAWMFSSYYFFLDNVVTPFKNIWRRSLP